MGGWLLRNVQSLRTKFGKFREKLEERVKASGPAAHDLLPISVEGSRRGGLSPGRPNTRLGSIQLLVPQFLVLCRMGPCGPLRTSEGFGRIAKRLFALSSATRL